MTPVNWDPSPRVLREFAAVAAGALIALAWRSGAAGTRAALLVAALALVGIAWRWPQRLRLPFVMLTLLMSPIGNVASHLVLGVLFFGVITPLGSLARLMRRDPLRMRLDHATQTDWQPHDGAREVSRYLRQS